MNANNVRKIKWVIRNSTVHELVALLPEALSCRHPDEVLDIVNQYLDSKDMGGLTRAGL